MFNGHGRGLGHWRWGSAVNYRLHLGKMLSAGKPMAWAVRETGGTRPVSTV